MDRTIFLSHSLRCLQHFSANAFFPLYQCLSTLSFLSPYLWIYSSVSRSIENSVYCDEIPFTPKEKEMQRGLKVMNKGIVAILYSAFAFIIYSDPYMLLKIRCILLNERPRDSSLVPITWPNLKCSPEREWRVSLLFTLFRDENPTPLFKQHTNEAINQ